MRIREKSYSVFGIVEGVAILLISKLVFHIPSTCFLNTFEFAYIFSFVSIRLVYYIQERRSQQNVMRSVFWTKFISVLAIAWLIAVPSVIFSILFCKNGISWWITLLFDLFLSLVFFFLSQRIQYPTE